MLSYVETVDTLRSKHVMLQWFNVDTVDTVVFAAFMQMHTDTHGVLHTSPDTENIISLISFSLASFE